MCRRTPFGLVGFSLLSACSPRVETQEHVGRAQSAVVQCQAITGVRFGGLPAGPLPIGWNVPLHVNTVVFISDDGSEQTAPLRELSITAGPNVQVDVDAGTVGVDRPDRTTPTWLIVLPRCDDGSRLRMVPTQKLLAAKAEDCSRYWPIARAEDSPFDQIRAFSGETKRIGKTFQCDGSGPEDIPTDPTYSPEARLNLVPNTLGRISSDEREFLAYAPAEGTMTVNGYSTGIRVSISPPTDVWPTLSVEPLEQECWRDFGRDVSTSFAEFRAIAHYVVPGIPPFDVNVTNSEEIEWEAINVQGVLTIDHYTRDSVVARCQEPGRAALRAGLRDQHAVAFGNVTIRYRPDGAIIPVFENVGSTVERAALPPDTERRRDVHYRPGVDQHVYFYACNAISCRLLTDPRDLDFLILQLSEDARPHTIDSFRDPFGLPFVRTLRLSNQSDDRPQTTFSTWDMLIDVWVVE